MAIVYFDSSALVKLLVEEEGSGLASVLWDECDMAVSSRLAHPEVQAALAALHRNHDLDDEAMADGLSLWADVRAAMRSIELTEGVEQEAGRRAIAHGLRGADAVHLASALALGDGQVIVAVWDQRLRAGALAAGLTVAPAPPVPESRGT
jgi:predicted nucleic acid-binding protein